MLSFEIMVILDWTSPLSLLHLYGCKPDFFFFFFFGGGGEDCTLKGAGIVTFWECKLVPLFLSVLHYPLFFREKII